MVFGVGGGSCAALGGNSPFLMRISRTSSIAWLLVDIEKAVVFVEFSLDTEVGTVVDVKGLVPPSCIVTNNGPCVIWCLFLTASSYFGGSRNGIEKKADGEFELSLLVDGCDPNVEVT